MLYCIDLKNHVVLMRPRQGPFGRNVIIIDDATAEACELTDGQLLSQEQIKALRAKSVDGYRAAEMPTQPVVAEPVALSSPHKGSGVGVPQVQPTFDAEDEIVGQNGRIRLRNGLIEITRGLKDDLVLGNQRGTKAIPIRSIQAVQFKRAPIVPGAIEFVVAGDRSNTAMDRMQLGGSLGTLIAGKSLARAASENTVTFTRGQEPPFIRLHEHILALIGMTSEPAIATPVEQAPVDLVGQLERLRGLFEAGVVTDDEFATAKARLLNG